MRNLRELLSKAEDWSDITGILADTTEEDIPGLRPVLPELLQHPTWVVRCDALDLIGEFRLDEFTHSVKKAIHDRNRGVRSYALAAYYDLVGRAGLDEIRRASQDKDVHVRVHALSLLFVETTEGVTLDQIARIVVRKRCNYHHQYCVLHVFAYYLQIETYPQVIDLFRRMREKTPEWSGIRKDLDLILKQCREVHAP